MADSAGSFDIVLFYQYTEIPKEGLEALEKELRGICEKLDLGGRIIIADEGINGNLAGSKDAVTTFCEKLRSHQYFCKKPIDFKMDCSGQQPFPDLTIKIKKEICSTGNAMPKSLLFEEKLGGNHLSPKDFHSVLQEYWESGDEEKKKKIVVLDVRNNIEYAVGRFKTENDDGGEALNPETKTFAEWPKHIRKAADEQDYRNKKVMMYCTGGIRCEKASAYLRSIGCTDVNQLSGGIHRYLEEFGSDGYFKGSNFVFDSRALQVPENAKVVGKCFICKEAPTEAVSCDRVCAVCRVPVLVCDQCRVARAGVYYCSLHEDLTGIYEPFLEKFSIKELQEQKEKLKQLREKYKGTNRVRSMYHQMQRIDQKIADKERWMSKQRKPEKANRVSKWGMNPRCRSCGFIGPSDLLELMGRTFSDMSLVCDGKCVGCSSSKYEDPKTSLEEMNDPSFGYQRRSRKRPEQNGKGSKPPPGMMEEDEDGCQRKRDREWVPSKSPNFRKRVKLETLAEYAECKYDVIPSSDDPSVMLRRVVPYSYEFQTHTKARWEGRELLEMYTGEFSANKRSYYKKAIEWGLISINGQPVTETTRLKEKDLLINYCHRHEPPVLYVPGKDMIVAETDEILVVDKPASVTVHPSGGYRRNSLTFILAVECGLDALFPVHRLDRLTSGLVLFGKTKRMANRITKAIEQKTDEHSTSHDGVQKAYLAHVHGKFPKTKQEAEEGNVLKEGRIYWEDSSMLDLSECKEDIFTKNPMYSKTGCIVVDWPCRLHDARQAINEATPLEEIPTCKKSKSALSRIRLVAYDPKTDSSIVQCEPITGRTHQLRIHLAKVGFYIQDDPNYGKDGNVAMELLKKRAEMEAPRTDRIENPKHIPDEKPVNATKDDLAKILCVSCNEGEEIAFKSDQMRHSALSLHAYRYKLYLPGPNEKKVVDYHTKLPGFARKLYDSIKQ